MKCCRLLSVAIITLALLHAHALAVNPTTAHADVDQSGRPVPPPVMSADTLKACRFLIDASAKQAAAISDPKDAANAVRFVSASRAEIGDFDGAIAAWEKFPGGAKENLWRTATVLAVHRSLYGLAGLAARVKGNAVLDSTLASALAEHGRLAEAVVFLDRIKKPFDHSRLLLEIVQEACRRRNDKLAAQMLEVHRDELLKDWTESYKVTDRSIARYASLQAGCGKLDAARATIKTIKDPQTQAEALATVGGALAYRGDLAGAKSIAAELSDSSRDDVYEAIIGRLVDDGKIAIAEEKKAREDGNADRYNCSYILWAIASTGKLAKMTETCESLTADPVLRCEIYGEAVDYLIEVPGGE